MVATRIVGLYFSVWKLIVEDEVAGHDVIDLASKLPQLRNAFTCTVCDQLMTNREVISPSACMEHFACKGCKGKLRQKTRQCAKCEDWSSFEDSELLATMIQTYQDFCYHTLTCPKIVRLLEVKHEVDPSFDAFKLIDVLSEAIKGATILKEVAKIRMKRQLSSDHAFPSERGIIPIPITPKRIRTTPLSDNNNVAVTIKTKNESPVIPVALPQTVQRPVAVTVDKITTKKVVTSNAIENPEKVTVKASLVTPAVSAAPGTSKQIVSIPVSASIQPQKQIVVLKHGIALQTTKSVISTPTTPSIVASAKPKVEPIVGVPIILPDKPTTTNIQETENKSLGTKAPGAPEEDTYILGLPLPESPTKTIVSTTMTASTPSTLSSMPSTTAISMSSVPIRISPSVITAATRPGGPQFLISQPDGSVKTIHISPHQLRLATASVGQSTGRIPLQLITGGPTTSGLIATGRAPSVVVNNIAQQQQQTPTIHITSSASSPSTAATAANSSSGEAAPPKTTRYILATTFQELQRQHPWADGSKSLRLTPEFARLPVPSYATVKPNIPSEQLAFLAAARARNTAPAAVTTVRSPSVSGSLVRPINTNINATVTATTGTTLPTQQSNVTPAVINRMAVPATANIQLVRSSGAAPVILRTEGGQGTRMSPNPSQVPASTTTPTTSSPTVTTALSSKRKQEGCRCGNATPTPGKLTCIGQRCACYALKTACSDCKCKGCKNPYVPGGQKILHGVRALIDPQTNQAIPLLAAPMTSVGSGSTSGNFVSPNSSITNPTIMATIGSPSNVGPIQAGHTVQNHPPLQIIPIRYGTPGNYTTQYLQIGTQSIQQLPIILSSTHGTIQAPSGGGIAIHGLQGLPLSSLSTSPGTVHPVAVPQIQHQRPIGVPTTTTPTLKVERNPNE